MRAIVQDGYGNSEVLHSGSPERPSPKNRQVLVRVQAAGLDRGTWHMMTGTPLLMRAVTGVRRPRTDIPGIDLAGTVAAVGPGVSRFAVGDQVFGVGRGSFAQYAVAREDKLAAKPASLSFAQAAVVPTSAATALQSLRLGRAAAGQHVLVTGASGGVGSYAVQLAKILGARVTAVGSTTKQDFLRDLGADKVIDYTREDCSAGSEQFDLVLDMAGHTSLDRLRRVLTPKGTLVIVGMAGAGKWLGMSRQLHAVALSPFVRQRLTMLASIQRASDLDELSGLIEATRLSPPLDRIFPLKEAAAAMDYLVAGKVRGKVAISI